MGLWKIKTLMSGEKKAELDLEELKLRLKYLTKQNDSEVISLALQSILDELEE